MQDGNVYDLLAFEKKYPTEYDIFHTRRRSSFEEGERFLTKRGRYSAYLTLDALKLFVVEYLGLTAEQAREVQASVTSMFAFRNRGSPSGVYYAVFNIIGNDGRNYNVTADCLGDITVKAGESAKNTPTIKRKRRTSNT